MSASRTLYRLLLILLGPLLLPRFIWQGWRGGVKGYARARLGFIPPQPESQPAPLWFHAASVGELNAIIPLLRRLGMAHPEQAILLTTTTISGFHNAQRRIPGITHHYLPFDFHHSIRRFIRRLQPKALFVVETELWPNLFRQCRRQAIPVAIINGRLSQKSLSSPRWVRRLYREVLGDLSLIAARSDTDREAFIALGAAPAKCQTLGNIKYSAALEESSTDAGTDIDTIKRPIVVAASTRAGEEKIIADSWRAAETGEHLLVIVPRHPERLLEILKDLASYHVAIRSRGETPTDRSEIYLADTFGELNAFMARSSMVLMGGSFVARGGQNLIEPAAMGLPIIVGPHMENFAEETRDLLAQQALVQLTDDNELSRKLSELIADPEQRQQLGERARHFVEGQADVIERYLALVEGIINSAD